MAFPEYLQIPLLLVVGTLAGFINVMAGGGSTLSLPILIFLGLDSSLANGTNRVAIFVQNVSAVLSFRQQKFQEFGQSWKFAAFTLPGSVIGALLAVRISDEWFQRILGIIMIAIVCSMFFKPPQSSSESISTKRMWISYLAMFGIGFYGGFIQVGVGFLLMAILYHLLQMNLIHVNMHKVFIVFIYTIPALGIFIWTGNVNWILGLSLAAGNATGGWIGAHATVKGGEKIVRIVLSIAILIMAVKLLGIV